MNPQFEDSPKRLGFNPPLYRLGYDARHEQQCSIVGPAACIRFLTMKRAVAISFNWNTGETLHEIFTGEGCADKAAGWVHPKSFIARDFPASEGWEHFAHWNKEAGEERGKRIAEELCSHGTISESVPK